MAWHDWLLDHLRQEKQTLRTAPGAFVSLVIVAVLGGWVAGRMFYAERIQILETYNKTLTEQLAAIPSASGPPHGPPLFIGEVSLPAGYPMNMPLPARIAITSKVPSATVSVCARVVYVDTGVISVGDPTSVDAWRLALSKYWEEVVPGLNADADCHKDRQIIEGPPQSFTFKMTKFSPEMLAVLALGNARIAVVGRVSYGPNAADAVEICRFFHQNPLGNNSCLKHNGPAQANK